MSTIEPEHKERRLLDGKIALVTGGAYGIGKAIVHKFLLEGASVAIFDKDQQRLQETLAELLPQNRVIGFNLNITDEKGVIESLTEIESRLGIVDVLVNNAAIEPIQLLIDHPTELFKETLDNNVVGPFIVTKNVTGRMLEQGKLGTVTFITSVHTDQAFPGNSAYDTTKHALLGFMKTCAIELAGKNIRFNAIAPGAIYPTGMTENITQERLKELGNRIPQGRFGSPDEIAEVAVFLASDMASYINGQEIRVDGGLSIKTPLFG